MTKEPGQPAKQKPTDEQRRIAAMILASVAGTGARLRDSHILTAFETARKITEFQYVDNTTPPPDTNKKRTFRRRPGNPQDF